MEIGDGAPDILPDVREVDGYVHSSLPLGIRTNDGQLVVHRLRQTVSPDGTLTEAEHLDQLDLLDAGTLIDEASAAGLEWVRTITVEESDRYVGSSILLLARGS